MKVSELIRRAECHLLVYGDGPVVVETQNEVLDVRETGPDKFEPNDDEPWHLVLVADAAADSTAEQVT